MNDFDELDELERDLGPLLRVALRRTAAQVTATGTTTSPPTSDHDPVSPPVQDRVTMIDLETSPRAEPAPPRRRPWLIVAAIAAAAVVVVVVTVTALLRRNNTEPADQPVEPAAQAFMDAWVRGDGNAVAALIAPDGSVDRWAAQTLPALHDWLRAVGWHYQDEGCEVISPLRVSCDYRFQNDLTNAFGSEPMTGSFVLTIDGSVVTDVTDELDTAAFNDIWDAFSGWVRANHPDDFDRMYTLSARDPLVDSMSTGLWERHIHEFIESGAAYIARADAICTAAHERYDGLVAASAGGETANSQAAADIIDEALAELRAIPPPEASQARFEYGYRLLEQLADTLRPSATATPPTPIDAPPPTPEADADLANLLHSIEYLELGLGTCAINPTT